jgi:hypothetical protein
MDWMKQLDGVMNRYAGGNAVPDTVHDDYDRVAQAAPRDALSDGLAAAFRSDQTPPFARMASQMFGRSAGGQRATILNLLVSTVGPMVVQQILARRRAASAGAAAAPSADTHITPQMAEQITPDEVEEIAAEAEKKDPSIVDRISHGFAEQPQLLKVLGGAALAIALGRMAQRTGAL